MKSSAAFAAALTGLAADASFWQKYQQVQASEFTEVADDEVDSLATDIGKKYAGAFDNSRVCAEMNAIVK